MVDREKVIKGLERCIPMTLRNGLADCGNCPYDRKITIDGGIMECCHDVMTDALALLKAQEPRVMTLDLPPEEWQDKVIWLEIKGKKPIPCLFRKFCDRMMFGRYERIMSFDAIGSSKEGGYFMRNYGVTWRCWTARPTDEQIGMTPWKK